ncbi:MAG: PTS sugar transporter subunit IIA [Paracoccaceae bacterium]|jgi:PTS system nitrogen regulatory IIA component|nr:PTS sugar transporter subunit IIA [Paracoccaceae bacterium]MDP7186242.1 PTS sugar transporter subunit IIA [Paracoccaceae bacterium]
MQLSEILRPEAVKVVSSTTSKKRLFQELGDYAAAAYGMDGTMAAESLIERENLGPTAVGHGVALPHARISALESLCGVFILLEKPVEMSAPDREPVDLIFTLFAPEDAGVEHLKALALISRTLKESNIRAKLRANADASALYAILTEGQTSEAA